MKRRRWLLMAVISVFTVLAMTIALWIAHTRVITNAIASLADNLGDRSMVLRYGDITFSKGSVLDVDSVIKDITITAASGGRVANSYHIEEVKINSNLWTRKLLLEVKGDVKVQGDLGDKVVKGEYKFTHNPMVEINFRSPVTKSWNSIDMIQQIKLESVGYQYLNEQDGKMVPAITLESVSGVLENRGEKGVLDWGVKLDVVNHEYLKDGGFKMDKIMMDLYDLVASSGKNNLQLVMNISEKNNMKFAKEDKEKFINLQIEEFKLSSQIYSLEIKGEIEKREGGFMPYFDVEVHVDDLEKMLSYYADALNISFQELSKAMPGGNFSQIKSTDVAATSQLLREISRSPDSGAVSIKILRDANDFQIAGISFPEFIQRIQDACAKADISKAKKVKSKRVK